MEEKLTVNEKFLLQYIKDITSKGKLFYRCDKSLSDILEINVKSVNRLINNLIKKEYLIKGKMIGGKRLLAYSGKKFIPLPIYSDYKSLKVKKSNENELKSTIDVLRNQNAKLLLRIDSLVSNNEILLSKIKELEKSRDELIEKLEEKN